jgi:hypothetical protein
LGDNAIPYRTFSRWETAFRIGALTAYIHIDGHSMPIRRYTSVAIIEQWMEENMHKIMKGLADHRGISVSWIA